MNMRPFAVALFFLLALAPTALAQTQATGVNTSETQKTGVDTSGQSITLVNPLGGDCSNPSACLMNFLNRILEFVIRIGTIVVILMLVYIGYLFVVAQGVPGEITKAREALKWTIVGALILLGAQAISLGIAATVQAIATGN